MNYSAYKTTWMFLTYLLIFILVSACGNGGGGGGAGTPVTYTISGTITPPNGTQIDSDVNDPAYPFVANDSVNSAQLLPNPVTLGGFVSVGDSGLPGSRFANSADTKDFFRIKMLAGQSIRLLVAESSSRLDLILYDSGSIEIPTPVPNLGENETITVPGNYTGARDFFVEVRALAGNSLYVLTIGLASQSTNNIIGQMVANFVPNEFIVRFKDQVLPAGVVDSLQKRANSIGLQARAGAPGRNMLMRMGNHLQVARLKKQFNIIDNNKPISKFLQAKLDTILVARALAKRPDIEHVRLNYIYQAQAVPNDSQYPIQWHYPLINLPQAWDVTQGSNGVIVAVIDTGVLLNHPDFVNADNSSQLVPGFDFIRDPDTAADNESDNINDDIDSNPNDPGDGLQGLSSSFHGTHVAATIAAATNNAIGVAGVGWHSRIMPLRTLGVGGGTSYDIEQAILFAAGRPNDSNTVPAKKADIINLSLGSPGADFDINGNVIVPDAYKQARAAGVIVIAAAGNGNTNTPLYPAAYDGVVSVSAVNINKERAFYTNFGSTIDVAAPGGDTSQNLNGDNFADGVMSAAGSDATGSIKLTYGLKQGTSMAAPHIAGVAALMKAIHPGMTPAEFDTALQSGAITEDLGAVGRDDQFGHGLIDALSAVLTAQLLAGGGVLPDNPFLAVSPGSLNLSTSGINAIMNVRNAATGVLNIISVTEDSGGWLSIAAPIGDVLGDYTVSVDRTNLADNTYTATITIVSSVNTVIIPVIMQVVPTPIFDDAGLQYILLYDANDNQVVQQKTSSSINGSYVYSFADIAAGEYHIVTGTDLNNDGFICDIGEACGVYPNSSPDQTTFILNSNLPDADIVAGFNDVLSGNAVTSDSAVRLPQKIRVDKRLTE